MIKTHYGKSSYNISNESVEVFTTVLGGNTTAYFKLGKKTICPYFIAPWWKEPWLNLGSNLLNVCRGNFFCLPMGGDPEGYSGKVIPVHGSCANENWDQLDRENDNKKKLSLVFRENDFASIHKEITIKDSETIIYEKNTVMGYEGDYPIAYHPMIKLPTEFGKAHLAIGEFIDGFTTKEPHEDPAMGGYYLFKNDIRINNIKRVPTIYGDFEDLSKQPIRKGFEEVAIFITDKNQDIGYSAITNKEDGYLYFQLKNPKEFQSTMLWISNGGRHYPPWNGRCDSVIGLEETTSFFHYGLKKSAENNFLNERGYRTFSKLNKNEKKSFKLISGVVDIPEGFSGVEKIEKKDNGIVITGLNNEKIIVSVDVDYLK